jgi:stress-induced morphogen
MYPLFYAGGQMYNIIVESPLFVGKTKVQQHKLVTSSIQEELKSIHGYNLKTKVPDVPAEEPKTETPKQEEK